MRNRPSRRIIAVAHAFQNSFYPYVSGADIRSRFVSCSTDALDPRPNGWRPIPQRNRSAGDCRSVPQNHDLWTCMLVLGGSRREYELGQIGGHAKGRDATRFKY